MNLEDERIKEAAEKLGELLATSAAKLKFQPFPDPYAPAGKPGQPVPHPMALLQQIGALRMMMAEFQVKQMLLDAVMSALVSADDLEDEPEEYIANVITEQTERMKKEIDEAEEKSKIIQPKSGTNGSLLVPG